MTTAGETLTRMLEDQARGMEPNEVVRTKANMAAILQRLTECDELQARVVRLRDLVRRLVDHHAAAFGRGPQGECACVWCEAAKELK